MHVVRLHFQLKRHPLWNLALHLHHLRFCISENFVYLQWQLQLDSLIGWSVLFLAPPFSRATTPSLDLVTRFRLLAAAGKLFQFFAWFSFVGPNSFPYIVHGGDFIKILKRQCNANINDLQLLSKSWRTRKVYTDYFWQALWWSDRARDNFWWGKIQTQLHFPPFPIFSRVNRFIFGSELFIRLSCSWPCT